VNAFYLMDIVEAQLNQLTSLVNCFCHF